MHTTADRISPARRVKADRSPCKGGTVLLGFVLVLCLLGDRLGGDAAEQAVPRASHGPLAPGQPAPSFVIQDLHGRAVALQDYQGRPVVINFWATWCIPCRKEMPVLQAVYEAHQATGLVVLAVNQDQQDQKETVRSYAAALGLTFSPLLDPDGMVAKRYNVFFLPSTVFIHPTGSIAAMHLGPMTQAQIERYLVAIMPQSG